MSAPDAPAPLEAEAAQRPPAPPVSVLAFVLRALGPHRLDVTLLFLGLLVDVAFGAGVPLGLEALIDRALVPRDATALRGLLGALAAATVIAGAVAIGREVLYARIGSAVPSELRQQLFEKLQRLPMAFYARTEGGDVLSRFSGDLAAIEDLLTVGVPLVVLSAVGIAVYLGLLFTLEPRLATVVLLGMPLCLLGPRLFGGPAAEASHLVRAQEASIVTAVQENVFAQPIVKLFGLRLAVTADFARRTVALRDTSRRFILMSLLTERVPLLVVLGIQLGVLGAGSYLVFHGRLTVGALVAFHALFVSLSAAVALLSQQIPVIVKATGGVARLTQLLDEPVSVEDAPGAPALPRPAKHLVLRDVSFGYTDARTDLAGVSLTIPHGAQVAFVGPSGSGKSTILNLLTRFYDPRAGALLVDGTDLRQVTQDSWRSHLAVVFQESFLFDVSVRENIRVGRPTATDDEVEDAARSAEIHDDVSRMPRGYDTPVGQRGGHLSGGQRQRVAIARALLRDPAILLLDEATSALDPGSEAAINQTLARVASRRTVISVTHRLSAVREMDRIFVLAQGRLVEQGAHEELMARGGLYRALAARQGGMSVSPDGSRARVDAARLRDFPPFADLADDLLSQLADKLVTTHLPAGATVVREGEPGDWFYIVVRGSVAAWKRGRGGERRNLATYRDGEYFGEIALLRDVPRKATVETTAETTLLGLDRATFEELLTKAPALREALHRDFAATTI